MYTVNDAFWLVVFLQRLPGSFHLTGNVDSTGIELEIAFRYELVGFPVWLGSGAWPPTLNSFTWFEAWLNRQYGVTGELFLGYIHLHFSSHTVRELLQSFEIHNCKSR